MGQGHKVQVLVRMMEEGVVDWIWLFWLGWKGLDMACNNSFEIGPRGEGPVELRMPSIQRRL
jgi:hypothetical protein